jgi:hypothetical protein
MILGREWLKQNGVRLYFDLGYLRIDKTYVRLEEDIPLTDFMHGRSRINFGLFFIFC